MIPEASWAMWKNAARLTARSSPPTAVGNGSGKPMSASRTDPAMLMGIKSIPKEKRMVQAVRRSGRRTRSL